MPWERRIHLHRNNYHCYYFKTNKKSDRNYEYLPLPIVMCCVKSANSGAIFPFDTFLSYANNNNRYHIVYQVLLFHFFKSSTCPHTSPVLKRIGLGWWQALVSLEGGPKSASLIPSQKGSPSVSPGHKKKHNHNYLSNYVTIRIGKVLPKWHETRLLTLYEVEFSSSIGCTSSKTVAQSRFTRPSLMTETVSARTPKLWIFWFILNSTESICDVQTITAENIFFFRF